MTDRRAARSPRRRQGEDDPAAVASSGVRIRQLRDGDVASTAALHSRALPGGFFPRLGGTFLRSYHCTFADSPHALGLVCVDDGDRPYAFLLAVLDTEAHGAYVLRRWGARLAARALLALLLRPHVLWVFLRTRVSRYARGLWRRHARAPVGAGRSSGRVAVLSHVAVADSARGSGAGGALVRALHEHAAAAGATEVVLVTAADGAAPGFYRHLGYHEEGAVESSDGAPWLRFRQRLP